MIPQDTDTQYTLATGAIEWARQGWKVFPLIGKIPAIHTAHPGPRKTEHCNMPPYAGDPLRGKCKGGCGRLGHGLYDATNDVETVTDWWTDRFRGHNIGWPIPEGVLLIDTDPRNGGDISWDRLIKRHGPWPDCLMQYSGRGDGGCHRFVKRPPGRITARDLGRGIDLKSGGGYVVLAPSIHPETGGTYVRIDGLIPDCPEWFAELIIDDSAPRRLSAKAWVEYGPKSIFRRQNGGGLIRTVATAVEGHRNHTLYWAACRAVDDGLLLDDCSLFYTELFDAAESTGLEDFEITMTLESAMRARLPEQGL